MDREVARLAIVCGTYRLPAGIVERGERRRVDGPRGSIEVIDDGTVWWSNRHGLDERTPVHRVDHATNMAALATGCDRALAIGSCGSLHRATEVGTVLLLDDTFAPWTTPTIFDDARAESMPGFDLAWRARVLEAWRLATSTSLVDGGTYVQSPGPRFETPAEIRFYATVGDVVGMTLAAEMVVAAELGIAHAAIVMVDNLANGIGDLPLTKTEFEANVAANRDRLWIDVEAVAARLS